MQREEILVEARLGYDEMRRSLASKGTWPEFDVLLARFGNDCENFTEIGLSLNLSRERVRQIYQKYFSKLIPRRPNGKVRRKVCTIKRTHAKVLSGFLAEERYVQLLQRVSEEGISALPAKSIVPGALENSRRFKHSEGKFLLNNRSCKLLVVFFFPPAKMWAFQVSSLDEIEFVILQANTEAGPRFLVVPSEVLEGKGRVYVPQDFKRSGYHKTAIQKKINWEKYLEAWHLLKDPKTATESAAPSVAPSPVA